MSRAFRLCLALAALAACNGRSASVTDRASGVTVVAGKRQGPATFYWDTGELAAKGEFQDDKPKGTWTYTWPGGGLQCRGVFVDGEQDGPWVFMSRTGQILDDKTFTARAPGEADHITASWAPECPFPSLLFGTGLYDRARRVRSLDAKEVDELLAR
jgi:hypothetical protein